MTVPKKKAGLLGQTAFSAASLSSAEMGAYRPVLRSPDAALLQNRETLDSRVRDMERNSGLLYSLVDQKLNNVVGASLRPQVKPNWRALGITQEQARDLGRQIEAVWSMVESDPDFMADAGRRLSLAAMARVEYWHWLVDGRAATMPLWLPRYGSTFGTVFMPIDPTRVSNPDGQPDSRYLRGGIEIDRWGAATAYHVKERNPGDIYASANDFGWTRVPAYTRWGRRRFIYGFAQRQAEQTQGRSPLLGVLKKIRMFEKRDDLELAAAIINATYATYVYSDLPSDQIFKALSEAPAGDAQDAGEAVLSYMETQAAYYRQNSVMVDGAVIPHLLPGEQIKAVEGARATSEFTQSQRQFMTNIGWALGLPYELASGDFSKSAYVGMQAAFQEAHKATVADRKLFCQQMMTPKLDLLVEEAIAAGMIEIPRGAPAYAAARGAYLNVEWIGPGRAVVDPLKDANARKVNMMTGNLTLEQSLAEDGIDVEDQIAAIGREEELRDAAEIPSLWDGPTTFDDPNAPDPAGYEPQQQG
jgi:lambda family phage portal protein